MSSQKKKIQLMIGSYKQQHQTEQLIKTSNFVSDCLKMIMLTALTGFGWRFGDH